MIHKLIHKFPFVRQSLFAFVPWVAFWGQHGANISDLSYIKVAVTMPGQSCGIIKSGFKTQVARTLQSRSKGLGGRSKKLKADEAMVFVFERPQPVSFWMKDTLIPLQIAYFDRMGKLVDFFHMPVEKDPANPERQYPSRNPVLIAVEMAPYSLKQVQNAQSELCADL